MEEHTEEYKEIDYEIQLFCPVDNEWKWAYDEGYYNEAEDDQHYNMEDALLEFNDICNKIKKERYSKVKLVKNNNKIVDNNVETLSTEIIREFEQKIEMVTFHCCYCECQGIESWCNPNDPQLKLDIEKEGLKKYISPCNGIKNSKKCICGECETSWFCEDCIDELDEKHYNDGCGLILKKIKKIKQEEQEEQEYQEQVGGVEWDGWDGES